MGEEFKRYHDRLAERGKERTMPPQSLGYVLKYPLPTIGRLYSVLEGQEQLEEQLEAMFDKRTLN